MRKYFFLTLILTAKSDHDDCGGTSPSWITSALCFVTRNNANETVSSDKLSNGTEFWPKNHELSAWLKNINLCGQSTWAISVTYDFLLKKERKKATILCVISESSQLLRVLVRRYSFGSVLWYSKYWLNVPWKVDYRVAFLIIFIKNCAVCHGHFNSLDSLLQTNNNICIFAN